VQRTVAYHHKKAMWLLYPTQINWIKFSNWN